MVPLEERLPIDEVVDLIQVGELLPFKVLDAQARLLLNAGQTIMNRRQYELLIARGGWVDRRLVLEWRRSRQPADAAREPVRRHFTLFDRWERLLWDLDGVLRRTTEGRPTAADWPDLVQEVITTVDINPDIALFGAVRQDDRRYALYPQAHALHAAVLCLMTTRQAGWTPERQASLVAAALSMNVAMIELQAVMAEQGEPPRPRQLEVIRHHPLQGVRLLREAGVTDRAWLRAVAEHHEHADGRGYPRGLREVCEEARLLRMADVYMAKITPRASRAPLPPLVASRQLFQQEAGSPLALTLIKAIGVHPPGALVQLKSGEVAVVKQRPAGSTAPVVRILGDAQGTPDHAAREADASTPEHAIVGPCKDTVDFPGLRGELVYGLVPG